MNYLQQFCDERNLSPSSRKQYKSTWNNYCQFHNMTVEQLIQEADHEEEEGIRLKRRTLKTRLVDYRTYLIEEKSSKNTLLNKMNQIKALYKHFEIEVPQLPYLSNKNIVQETPITYNDLPTKSIIREALGFANIQMQTFILLQCSSGMGKAEALSISVKQFLESCDVLDENKTIRQMLIELYRSKELRVPQFTLKRQKVNEYYYTFASAEFVFSATKMLLQRENVSIEDPLFTMHPNYVNHLFQEINDILGLGCVGKYRRFRSHMLRKFNASALANGENHLTSDEIDFLQGRSRGRVRETYMKMNPRELKIKYIEAMDNVLINHTSSVVELQRIEMDKFENKLQDITELVNKINVNFAEL